MELYPLTNAQYHTVPHGSVILFGCFDGVHPGHLSLLKEARAIAKDRPVVVWVIDRRTSDTITSLPEKCAAFASAGADLLLTENFEAIRSLTGEEFFRDCVMSLHPRAVVCGFNFRFGVRASSSAEDMRTMAEKNGILCSVVPPLTIDGMTVSSTAIRNAVKAGDLPLAEKLLGRPLSYTSEILHGRQIGRTISHPTVNQRIPSGRLIPPYGVYSCTVTFDEDGVTVTKGGVCNLGSRPTVNDDTNDVTLETYLFDFSGDLYGRTLTTSLCEMIRPERKFDSVDELRRQIEADEDTARASLARIRDARIEHTTRRAATE
ncbi:MAG: riboflavin biosynthesis protein RibF [Clostridia bacterium]|nr:riboflavin biosynthesis protein RibF [Clostridia bacterium]MBQ8370495.1 riboflavin biosynthesis protein RibF [Clostridia bacterium]